MKKSYIFTFFLIGFAVLILFVVSLFFSVMPSDPLIDSDQLVLVLSRTRNSQKAVLQTFDRRGDLWYLTFSFPVVIGKNGMAWGRGLHKNSDRPQDDPVKHEGDGASPEGAFEVLHAYGYNPPPSGTIRFPYTRSTPGMICVDDMRSRYYNKIIDITRKRLERNNLPSHETLLRDDDLYRYAIFVGHNTWRPEKGAGSCIFLHVWKGPESYTAGCTAMEEENILRLLSWLTTEKNPILIQLTRKNYYRIRDRWGLPDVKI